MTVLMIWLVSDFCTLMLVGAGAKRWWTHKRTRTHTHTHLVGHTTTHYESLPQSTTLLGGPGSPGLTRSPPVPPLQGVWAASPDLWHQLE